MKLRNLSKVKDQESGRDGLKTGLSSFKFCVCHIKMATDSGMELHGVRMASEESGWTDDRSGGRHDVGVRSQRGFKTKEVGNRGLEDDRMKWKWEEIRFGASCFCSFPPI